MMKRQVLAIVLPLFLCSLALAAGGPHVEKLDNGLTVVVEEDHSAPVATIQFFVGTGSTFEDNYLGAGISHFIEHTLTEGTATQTSANLERIRAELGNNSNAYTSKNIVSYYVVTSGEYVLKAIDYVGDYVFNATFPADQVEVQRGIILREMARTEDDPSRQLYNLFSATMFRASPEGIRIIGYPEQFKALKREDLVTYHNRAYVPANVVAVVVGDFDSGQVMDHLRETLGKLPQRAYDRPILPQEPPQLTPRRSVRHDPQFTRAYMLLGYPTVSLFSPDMYPLDVASYILTNGDAARLSAKLRDELGLVDSITSSSYTPPYDAGFFAVSATTSPQKADAAEKAIVAQLERLREGLVTPTELQRAKQQKEADLLYERVTTQGRAGLYGNDLLWTGDISFSERYVQKIKQVTAADIQRVARKYFLPEHYNLALLLPPAKSAGTTATSQSRPAASQRIEQVTLPNGLQLLVQENHAVPVVNVFIACRGGLLYEDPAQAGITSLMSNMLVRGTKTRNRLQIAAALEDVGGSLVPYSGRNSFGLSAQVRKQDLPLALDMAADVLYNPIFPEAELQQQKQMQLAGLQARADDVDTFANDLMLRTLFTVYPYRFPVPGTQETVSKLTRQDLIAYHGRYVHPSQMVVSVFGDTTLQQARQLVQKYFGAVPAGAVKPPTHSVELPLQGTRREELTRPQQQAVIVYGFRGSKITDPDRYATDVMTAVFAGIGYPGGRLHNTLRGAQLVYATFAYPLAGPELGYYAIYAGTGPENAEVVQQKIEDLIKGMQAHPPTPEELALAKNIAISSQAVELESSGARAQTTALNVMWGLGKDEIFRYADEINKVTAEQVQAQAKKLLDLQNKVLVITTPRPQK